MKKLNLAVMLLAGASLSSIAAPVMAQEAPQADTEAAPGDIVVTARRKDETLISVPVVVTAVSGENLQARGVTNLDGLARVVPQLLIGPQGGSVQGGNISIRGIAGPDSNPFGDQAVSFSIDGVQVTKANVRRMSDFDVAQVEVLKGPQALFFGKNSMAGIITIQTADPTDALEAKISAGYEFEGDEIRTEGYISAPLGDNFGIRVAAFYSDLKGYLKDQTPTDSIYFNDSRNPQAKDFGIRTTLKFEPSDVFDARLKFTYGRVSQNGPAAITGFTNCPLGVRQFSFFPVGADNGQCEPGPANVNAGYGPVVSQIPATLNLFREDGDNHSVQKQILSGLVMNFKLSDDVTLTSATGLYDVNLDQCQNYENSYAVILPSCNVLRNQEISQDLHLTTDYDGPLNFTAGAYFASTKATTGSLTYLFATGFPLLVPAGTPGFPNGYGGPDTPAQVNNYLLTQKGKAYSAFVELSYKPIEVVEINIGGRYSHERKRLTDVRGGGGIAEVFNPAIFKGILDDTTLLTVANGALAIDNDSWNDFSPEATISYRPNTDLTVFASYKHGFLSGGFNSSSVNFSQPNLDLSYRPQTIKGFEAGVKARAADGALLMNAAVYSYKLDDLQVVNFTNATSTIRNAAAGKVKGVEVDFNYRTPMDGLSIHGAAAYNDAKYSSFPGAPCYNGQTPAQGCTIVGGNPTQDTAGQAIARAPKWNVSGGFLFETPVGSSMKFGLSGDFTHSTGFFTDATNDPAGRQPKYTLFDASARIGAEDDAWELSLIGRNLGNKFYYVSSTNVPFTGGGTGTAAGTLGDRFGGFSRGREILLRASYKFGG